jgi:parallel beta-helix repeat protein
MGRESEMIDVSRSLVDERARPLMKFIQFSIPLLTVSMLIAVTGCKRSPESDVTQSTNTVDEAGVVVLQPGPEIQTELQEELILAEPGTVIQLEAGTYELTSGLSLDVDNVTVRGRGMDKTILSFKNQEAGAEGFYITSDHVLVEDLAIEDTSGNGLKSHKANNIILRRVRVEWTGGPKTTNGAYGIYPVSSENVLVEECIAIGGSDSGIYVGQSKDVIVRNCTARHNVAGIEIENCHRADVYGNTATLNTGGILVFDLPDLPQQQGHDIRLFKNTIHDNSTVNFAPKGNIVGTVPTGTGIMVMGNANVEIFDNDIGDHGTVNVLLVSYYASGNKINDPNYYAYPEGIHIHDNRLGACGDNPLGDSAQLMMAILGTPLPDILWDGVVNQEKLADGVLPPEARIYIGDNQKSSGTLTFGNLGGLQSLSDPAKAQPQRDLAAHQGQRPPVSPVSIEGLDE